MRADGVSCPRQLLEKVTPGLSSDCYPAMVTLMHRFGVLQPSAGLERRFLEGMKNGYFQSPQLEGFSLLQAQDTWCGMKKLCFTAAGFPGLKLRR